MKINNQEITKTLLTLVTKSAMVMLVTKLVRNVHRVYVKCVLFLSDFNET